MESASPDQIAGLAGRLTAEKHTRDQLQRRGLMPEAEKLPGAIPGNLTDPAAVDGFIAAQDWQRQQRRAREGQEDSANVGRRTE